MSTKSLRALPTEPPGAAPPGALPAKQERSRALRDHLIATARALIESGRYGQTSMSDFAREAGCAVGSLYTRFRDKDALFDCVVSEVMTEAVERLEREIAAGGYRGRTVEQTIDRCVDGYLAFIRDNEHLVRTLHQRMLAEPSEWAPVRAAATELVTRWIAVIVEHADRHDDRQFRRQLLAGFQLVAATMIHALLVDPPALKFRDPELDMYVRETVRHLASVTMPRAKRPQ